MLGCSAMLAAIRFVIGLLSSMTFLTSAALFALDDRRDRAGRATERRWRASRDDLEDSAFLAYVEPEDQDLALRPRSDLARFFGSPPSKLSLDDPLSALVFESSIPAIYLSGPPTP
jgi:hypothetical protein